MRAAHAQEEREPTIRMRWIIIGAALIAIAVTLSATMDPSCTRCRGITLVTWNAQNLGPTKVADGRADRIIAELRGADVIAIQEITDSSNATARYLCAHLQGYACRVSRQTGSERHEQLLIASRYPIVSTRLIDDPGLERGIYEARIELPIGKVTVATAHLKPAAAKPELAILGRVVPSSNTIVAGDLNADCSYLSEEPGRAAPRVRWIVPSSADTTSGATDCAYDRIGVSTDLLGYVAGYRVLDAPSGLSDHEPVELVIN